MSNWEGILLQQSNRNTADALHASAEASCPDETVSVTKRALLKASWIPPVIVALSLPRSGYAANISGKSNPGTQHNDNGNHFGQNK